MLEKPIADLPLVERLRIVSLAEAARLSGLSQDALRRHHADKLVRLSPRRIGMRQGDALMLASGPLSKEWPV
jgi:hypothetical protein